jgi:hypothetical protein
MSLSRFKRVKPRDLTNGACRDEIEDSLREREELLGIVQTVDSEMEGVECSAEMVEAIVRIRMILDKHFI